MCLSLEDGNPGLSAGILRLHVVHIGGVVLALVIVLRQTTQIRRARYRVEGRASLEPIRLRVCHAGSTVRCA